VANGESVGGNFTVPGVTAVECEKRDGQKTGEESRKNMRGAIKLESAKRKKAKGGAYREVPEEEHSHSVTTR